MFKVKYRIKSDNTKYLLQRRFFFKWITLGKYDNFYMANMVLNAYVND